MSAISRGSGSVYPDKKILDEQLSPKGKFKCIESQATGGIAPLAKRTTIDLTRLSSLYVNGQAIYVDSQIDAPPGTKAAAYVFNQMEKKLDSTVLAIRAADLFQQDTGGDILKAIALKKGITTKNENGDMQSTHSVVLGKNRVTVLDVTKAKFTITLEAVAMQRDLANAETGITFFKVKTIITGKTDDLTWRDTKNMSIKGVYTAEVDSEAAAIQTPYGLFDRTTYLRENPNPR